MLCRSKSGRSVKKRNKRSGEDIKSYALNGGGKEKPDKKKMTKKRRQLKDVMNKREGGRNETRAKYRKKATH